MKAKYHFIASIAGSVLFVAGFALATGVDANPRQALCVPLLMLGALACFRYAKRHVGSEQTMQARKARKRAKAA